MPDDQQADPRTGSRDRPKTEEGHGIPAERVDGETATTELIGRLDDVYEAKLDG